MSTTWKDASGGLVSTCRPGADWPGGRLAHAAPPEPPSPVNYRGRYLAQNYPCFVTRVVFASRGGPSSALPRGSCMILWNCLRTKDIRHGKIMSTVHAGSTATKSPRGGPASADIVPCSSPNAPTFLRTLPRAGPVVARRFVGRLYVLSRTPRIRGDAEYRPLAKATARPSSRPGSRATRGRADLHNIFFCQFDGAGHAPSSASGSWRAARQGLASGRDPEADLILRSSAGLRPYAPTGVTRTRLERAGADQAVRRITNGFLEAGCGRDGRSRSADSAAGLRSSGR